MSIKNNNGNEKPSTHLRVVKMEPVSQLTEAQVKFRRLQEKIEIKTQAIKDLKEADEYFHKRYVEKILPLKNILEQVKIPLIIGLEECLLKYKLSSKNKQLVTQFIQLLVLHLKVDPFPQEIVDVYNRVSDVSIDELKKQIVRAQLEEMVALYNSMEEEKISIDFDTDSIEDVNKFIVEKYADILSLDEPFDGPKKRPSNKAKEKIDKQKMEEESEIKSLRELYLALVKEFHPDKTSDEDEKLQRTAIMQRITEAYEQKNILELLRLQVEFLKIDPQAISNTPEEKLQKYNRLMVKTYKAIKEEYENLDCDIFDRYDYSFDVYFTNLKTAKKCQSQLLMELNGEIEDMQGAIIGMEKERDFKSEVLEYIEYAYMDLRMIPLM